MLIRGSCHCGNISFRLDWTPEPRVLPARACGCSFCVKHGGVWTACPAGSLEVEIQDRSAHSRYAFGTRTADFHVCARCGAVPVVTSEIDGRTYAVVNVNAMDGVAPERIERAPVSFDGEDEATRLARRRSGWIAQVRMPEPARLRVPPVIETPRLVLRSFRPDDAPVLLQALVDSRAALREFLWFLPWVAEEPTLASALARCRRAEAAFRQRTDLPYLAFERDSGRLVGSVGLHRTDWQLPKTEVGYWIRSGSTGRGYATEGVMALTTWALQDLGARRVELVTDEANLASRRVAERCGFALEGVHRHVQRAPDGALRSHCIYARLPAAA